MALGFGEGSVFTPFISFTQTQIFDDHIRSESSTDDGGGGGGGQRPGDDEGDEVQTVYSVSGLCGTQPLGYVLLGSGKLCPFGLLPPSTEADALGDPAKWVEVRVNPPSSMWTSEGSFSCPAEFCKEKMRKNLSMESHVKKHIQMIVHESNSRSSSTGDGELMDTNTKMRINETSKNNPVELSLNLCIKYCCTAKECGYGLSAPDDLKYFSCLKYLKQHYFKVHAPKTHQCEQCDKSFATAGFLDAHQRMCGNTFNCSSCGSSYSTLEALQTHCKRKQHVYDYTKYKDILSTSKQIQQSKKAEEQLKQKLAAVSINSSPPENSSKNLNQLPILTPRPTTITLSVDGASTSHVAWTYEEKTDVLRVRKEMATQTTIDAATEPNLCTSMVEKSKSTNNARNTKRKKSAETQTGKVTFRISTETQTSNVTKRRRTSKRQIAEAETQCTEHVISSDGPRPQDVDDGLSSTITWNSILSDMIIDSSPLDVKPVSISIPLIMELAGISGSPDLESKNTNLGSSGSQENQQESFMEATSSTATATIGVGNRFDEDLQELFDFNEELHQETQTDSTLFSCWTGSMSAYTNLESVFNNFTTAETQTLAGISPPKIDTNHEDLFPHSTNPIANSEDWLNFFDSPGSNLQDLGSSNSPSFLETMDNETQTQSPSPYSEYDDFFNATINADPYTTQTD